MPDLNYQLNRHWCECLRLTVGILRFVGKLAVNYLLVALWLSTPATSSGTRP